MNSATVMAEAFGFDGSYYMARGRRDAVNVSREAAWSQVKAWQRNEKIQNIRITRGGEVVWSWSR